MANNRYYLTCPVCSDQFFFGKSLGGGIYFPNLDEENHLQNSFDWLWYHMTSCHQDEFKGGTLFTIESEYQDASSKQ